MKNLCKNWKPMMELQMEELRAAIEEDKWYLSEQAHADVGMHCAEMDFVAKYLAQWAAAWRQEYCNKRCPLRHQCQARRTWR